jgi:plastocyanin
MLRVDWRRARTTAMPGSAAILGVLVAASACARPAPADVASYRPRTRELTVTTVPLLVREARGVYPFLKDAFAVGGVLEGKEVYAFSPGTLTVVEGDTVAFTLINPEDDEHAFLLPECTEDDVGSFVLPDCGVDLPPQRVTHATYVARRAGIYPILCKVAKHLPMMWGQLVVLAPTAVAGSR